MCCKKVTTKTFLSWINWLIINLSKKSCFSLCMRVVVLLHCLTATYFSLFLDHGKSKHQISFYLTELLHFTTLHQRSCGTNGNQSRHPAPRSDRTPASQYEGVSATSNVEPVVPITSYSISIGADPTTTSTLSTPSTAANRISICKHLSLFLKILLKVCILFLNVSCNNEIFKWKKVSKQWSLEPFHKYEIFRISNISRDKDADANNKKGHLALKTKNTFFILGVSRCQQK